MPASFTSEYPSYEKTVHFHFLITFTVHLSAQYASGQTISSKIFFNIRVSPGKRTVLSGKLFDGRYFFQLPAILLYISVPKHFTTVDKPL